MHSSITNDLIVAHDLFIGTRVGVENHFFCENCYLCEKENGAICMNMGQYGHGKKTTQVRSAVCVVKYSN